MSKRSDNPVSYVDLPVPDVGGDGVGLYSVLEGLCGDLEVSYRVLSLPPKGGEQDAVAPEARFIGRKWSLSALLAAYCGGDLESAASLSGLVRPTHLLRHAEALHAGDVADFQSDGDYGDAEAG